MPNIYGVLLPQGRDAVGGSNIHCETSGAFRAYQQEICWKFSHIAQMTFDVGAYLSGSFINSKYVKNGLVQPNSLTFNSIIKA